MRRKKFFGIGASVIMLLVVFIPAVNSTNINNSETSNLGGGVQLEILDGPYLKQRKPITKDTSGKLCTLWGVEYEIVNFGNKRIRSKPIMKVVTNDEEERVVASWSIDLNLDPNGGRFYDKRDIYINIEELGTDKVDEGDVADKLVKLECLGMDSGPSPDVKRAVKFWKYDKFYGPTLNQIAACLPRNDFTTINGQRIIDIAKLYEKDNRVVGFRCKGKTIQDVINSNEFKSLKSWSEKQIWEDWNGFMELLKQFIEKFEDVMDLFWEDLPNELNNQRFGWTKNLSRYFINIVVGITLFLLVAGSAAYTIVEMPEFVYLLGWINKWGSLFNAIKNKEKEIINQLIGELLGIDVLTKVIQYAYGLLLILEIVGGIELFLFAKIKYDIEQLKDWRSREPWSAPVTIYGRVDYVIDGETVTIECRDVKKSYTEKEDGEDGSIEYNFTVDAECPYKLPKMYRIKVSGSHPDHKGKDLETWGILSYCYSGGKVHKWFQNEGWKKKARSQELTYQPTLLRNLINKLSKIFENSLINEIIKKLTNNSPLTSLS